MMHLITNPNYRPQGTYLFFCEYKLAIDVVAEVSSFQVVNKEVAILPILKGISHVDQKIALFIG